jgi:hypothetical protein
MNIRVINLQSSFGAWPAPFLADALALTGRNTMAATTKTKAAERFANLQKRDQAVRHDIEAAARLRSEKVARLRELRLAKEAEDAEAKKKETAEKEKMQAPRKSRSRAATAAAG